MRSILLLLLCSLSVMADEPKKSARSARLKFDPSTGRRFTLTASLKTEMGQGESLQVMEVMLEFRAKVASRKKGIKVELLLSDAEVTSIKGKEKEHLEATEEEKKDRRGWIKVRERRIVEADLKRFVNMVVAKKQNLGFLPTWMLDGLGPWGIMPDKRMKAGESWDGFIKYATAADMVVKATLKEVKKKHATVSFSGTKTDKAGSRVDAEGVIIFDTSRRNFVSYHLSLTITTRNGQFRSELTWQIK